MEKLSPFILSRDNYQVIFEEYLLALGFHIAVWSKNDCIISIASEGEILSQLALPDRSSLCR